MIIKLTTLTRHLRHSDMSISVTFRTVAEQTSKELEQLDTLFQQHCLLAIKPEETPFLDNELKDLDSVDLDLEDKTKTPSKRLRNVLYRLWEQESNKEEACDTFKDFYKTKIEQLITQIKGRLE